MHAALPIPPRDGEGNRAKRGGGAFPRELKPATLLARQLRREMALPEVLLWEQLRGQKLGVKFRKGYGIGPYVVDFYCCSERLAVEVDGEVHSRGDAPDYDAARDAFLLQNGHRVVRFAASDILRNLDGVLAAIMSQVMTPLHRPLDGSPPRAGEE